jgi:hypothetical protein
VEGILTLWIAFAIALAIGLFARPAAAGLAAVAAATIALDLQAFSNHVTLLIALSALLALGNPSAAWSVDARLGRARASIPYWPVFLVKFQISTVYAFASLTKINSSFLGAEVLASRWEPVVGEPGGAVHAILVAIAISTVCVEGFLAVALWSARWRRVALPLGLGLHVTIAATLGAVLVPFGTLMLGAYVLFPAWRPGSGRVAWDGRLEGVERLVALLRWLDWFGVYRYSATRSAPPRAPDARAALQVRDSAGTREGFDAVRAILERSPVTFLVAPLLGLRPLTSLGARLYSRRVAADIGASRRGRDGRAVEGSAEP